MPITLILGFDLGSSGTLYILARKDNIWASCVDLHTRLPSYIPIVTFTMFGRATLLSALISAVSAGTIIWDGRFNEMSSSSDLEKWSWANQVGNYQYYIHGSGAVSKYVNLGTSFKNSADTGSKQGAKITIDSTAKWNSVSKTSS